MFKQKHAITTTVATLLFGSTLALAPAWAGDGKDETEMPASEHQAETTRGASDDAEGAERREGERARGDMPASEHQEKAVDEVEKDESGGY